MHSCVFMKSKKHKDAKRLGYIRTVRLTEVAPDDQVLATGYREVSDIELKPNDQTTQRDLNNQ